MDKYLRLNDLYEGLTPKERCVLEARLSSGVYKAFRNDYIIDSDGKPIEKMKFLQMVNSD